MSVLQLSTNKISQKIFNPVVEGGGSETSNNIIVDLLLVAGGGGASSGAGGAGGLLYQQNVMLPNSQTYVVQIGSGGTGVVVNHAISADATVGENTRFYNSTGSNPFKLIAYGGGKGARYGFQNLYGRPSDGGSGGGGQNSTGSYVDYRMAGHGSGLESQGNRGGVNTGTTGTRNGGGGGAGDIGQDLSLANYGGSGGNGRQLGISGTLTWYAGGGGSASYAGSTAASYGGSGGAGGGGAGSGYTAVGTPGVDGGGAATLRLSGGSGGVNTGGGGGGAWGASTAGSIGGSGGSGICIIRYAESYPAATTTGSVSYSVVSGYRIYKFTGTGTFVI